MEEQEKILDVKCKGCGQTVKSLMLLAMMVDAGARVYPSPTKCLKGKEHDFSPKEKA